MRKLLLVALVVVLGAVGLLVLALGRSAPRESEAFSVANGVVAALAARDKATLDALMDDEAFRAKAYAGFEISEMFRQFQAGNKLTLGDNFLRIAEHARYELLRVRTVDGEPRPILRGVSPAGEIGYLELRLARRGLAAKVTDVYVHFAGQWQSELLRRGVLPIVAVDRAKLVETPHDRAVVDAWEEVTAFQGLHNKQRHAEAIAAFEALPVEVRRDKGYLLLRCRSAQALGDPVALRKAFEEIKAACPGDPCLDMLGLAAAAWGQGDEALACVDRLDARVGGDPQLDAVRARIRAQMKGR